MNMHDLARSGVDWASMKWLTSYRLNSLRTRMSEMTRSRGEARLALILGCQRSGTTMLARAIGLSASVKDYGEGDSKYFCWDGAPRLLPLDQVATRLTGERNPLVLLKPLCESQRANELLSRFAKSKAIWIYRDYRDCVESHVKYYRQFHDGLAYVREMLNLEKPCWKNEGLSESMRERLRWASSRELSVESAYAVYWLARNSLVDGIDRDRLMVVRYEDVLANREEALRTVFRFLSIPYDAKFSRIVSVPSGKPGVNWEEHIEPELNEHCQRLLADLGRLSDSDMAAPPRPQCAGATISRADRSEASPTASDHN